MSTPSSIFAARVRAFVRPPADALGRFRWVLFFFGALNVLAFVGLMAPSKRPADFKALAAASLLLTLCIWAWAYRKQHQTLWVDLSTVLGLSAAGGGFDKPQFNQGLVFAWITWAQLYGSGWRAVLRGLLALGVLMLTSLMWDAQPSPLAAVGGTAIGVGMASLFAFSLGASLAKVQASEARFRSLIQNATDMVLVIDADTRLRYLSPQAAAGLGIADDGKGHLLGERLPAADLTKLTERLKGFAPSSEEVERIEFQVVRPNGGRIDCEAMISDQRQNPDVNGFILNVRDISERKEADALLRAQETQLVRAAQEFAVASQIQTSLLPKPQPVPGYDIGSAMQPAAEVGGDYFDIIETPGALFIAIGDVSGHGLSSGLVMLMAQSVVLSLVRNEPDAPLPVILNKLNGVLHANVRERLGTHHHMTFCLLKLSPNGEVRYAGAHESLLVLRQAGSVEHHDTKGTWLAAVADVSAATSESRLQLGPGDTLVLHTDGVTEARRPDGGEFGLDGLKASVARHAALAAGPLVVAVLQDVAQFTAEQKDDRSLVVARRKLL
ncbi:MAG: SpoIIE family protein phosphatase [Myxococcaceae bacterium]|nr:SpoIIE family protein phosphatase [Myxococcaceae bacterium]